MRFLGYSTGAIALGDFSRALTLLGAYDFQAIELSALRMAEVEPLLCALRDLDLDRYKYISFHAPSAFREEEEKHLVELLSKLPEAWPIVLHPDAIYRASRGDLARTQAGDRKHGPTEEHWEVGLRTGACV
jgi:hypothetical protein